VNAGLPTSDVVDGNAVAWDNFTAQIDPVALELERVGISAVSAEVASHLLRGERPGSRRNREQLWLHEVRRVESRRALSSVVVPLWFNDKQLQVAADWAAFDEARLGGMSGAE